MNARLDDDALLDALAQAVAPGSAEPSVAEVNALRWALAHPQADAAPLKGRWYRRPIFAIAATTTAVLAGSTAVATAKDGHMPAPVRSVARVVGIDVGDPGSDDPPVTSTTLPSTPTTAATRTTVDDHGGNRGPGGSDDTPAVSGTTPVTIDDDNSGPGGGGGDDRSGRNGGADDNSGTSGGSGNSGPGGGDD